MATFCHIQRRHYPPPAPQHAFFLRSSASRPRRHVHDAPLDAQPPWLANRTCAHAYATKAATEKRSESLAKLRASPHGCHADDVHRSTHTGLRGLATSGMIAMNGRTSSRTRTVCSSARPKHNATTSTYTPTWSKCAAEPRLLPHTTWLLSNSILTFSVARA